jgi:hypothetical protein
MSTKKQDEIKRLMGIALRDAKTVVEVNKGCFDCKLGEDIGVAHIASILFQAYMVEAR